MADIMSAVCAIPTIGPLGGAIVISALCCRFSTASITLVSKRSPSILRILLRPVSTSLRMVGVIWYFQDPQNTGRPQYFADLVKAGFNFPADGGSDLVFSRGIFHVH